MVEFANYYIEFLRSLLYNLGNYIKDTWYPFGRIFSKDMKGYFDDLSAASSTFGVGGWLLYGIVILINATLIFFLVYRFIQVFRRYILFRAKEVEKDELLEELAKTKDQVARLTIEKNQLYALKVNSIFAGGMPGFGNDFGAITTSTSTNETDAAATTLAPMVTRFRKLAAIDNKYASLPPFTSTVEMEGISLKNLIDRFINFASSQLHLYYKHDVIRCFFAGMATTKVLILEGISGTGKTSLPYALGKFFSGNATIVSVQPSWHDRADLLGYFNEFTKSFNETDFLSCIYEATYKEDPSIVILDEMNLARIEYYFAEFLSIMEMPDVSEWLIDVVPSGLENDPKNLIDGKILVPQGIWFVGTANQDDSTFTVTDKVYDRCIAIELNVKGDYFDAPLTDAVKMPYSYLDLLFQQALSKYTTSKENIENLKKVDEFLITKFRITFGNRIMRQILHFIPVFIACGGDEVDAIDFLLKTKIFRKLSSLNLAFLIKELNELVTHLDKLFGKGRCAKSIDFIKLLLRRV